MARKGAAAATKAATATVQGGYFAPWLSPVAVLGLGHVLHLRLGTTPLSATLAGVALTLAGVALSALTSAYARARGPVIRWHSTTTVALVFVQLVGLLAFGVTEPAFWLCLGLGAVLALSWNVRRLPAIRGDGADETNNANVIKELGLTVARKKVVTDAPERSVVKLKMGAGQTVADVQKALPALASLAATIPGGARATQGARADDVTLTLVHTDVLAADNPWPGPSHPGGSIADGWHIGTYEDIEPIRLYPAGNYVKNIAPGHVGQSGMPRSGKGVAAHVILADTSTRRDVGRILLCDTRKGEQFTDPIEDVIGWYADTDTKVKALIAGAERACVARNKALGQAGYSSWTPAAYDDPALNMEFLIMWLEEAPAYLDLFVRMLVGLGEAMLSSGMLMVVSAQLWKHDRVPTSLRSSIGNVIVLGAASSEDASYLLSDETIAAGIDPGKWKTKHPGRMAVEGNGIEPDRFGVPGKGFFASSDHLKRVTSMYGPMMAPYCPTTLAAFGDAYVPYVPSSRGAVVLAPASHEIVEVNEDDENDARQAVNDDEELPEERMGMYVVPQMDDDEMAALLAEQDPRAEDPGWEGRDVDMRPEPEPDARTWTREEKEAEFRTMLEVDFAGTGRTEFRTSELRDAWVARVGEFEAGKRWFLHELLGAWEEHGQIARLDGFRRGRYRIVTLAHVDYEE